MAGRIICVTYCRRYDFITICEHSKFATHKQRKAVFCCAEIADDGLRAFAIKKRTLHLTLLVECSVLYFIEKKYRFMMGVKLNWFSLGETALVFKYTYSKKYQPRFSGGDNRLFPT